MDGIIGATIPHPKSQILTASSSLLTLSFISKLLNPLQKNNETHLLKICRVLNRTGGIKSTGLNWIELILLERKWNKSNYEAGYQYSKNTAGRSMNRDKLPGVLLYPI